MRSSLLLSIGLLALLSLSKTQAQDPVDLRTLLRETSPRELARRAELLGSAQRGALVFFKSAASCAKCHLDGTAEKPDDRAAQLAKALGPSLISLGQEISAEHIVESILFPSRKIREGYATLNIITTDGKVVNGMTAGRRDGRLILRDSQDLTREIVLDPAEIEEQVTSDVSMMPEGLAQSLRSEREFYDLAKYVLEVARGGQSRAAQLRPSAQQLVIKDDTLTLDHAGILRRLDANDFEAGKKIYSGDCAQCHGEDGNQPKLPSARAFGSQSLKFGSDPLSMLRTLTVGNGLMTPMQHLSAKERYQVIHYIREGLMKDRNPEYRSINSEYLEKLPIGADLGERQIVGERDFGPVLGSQLGTAINNAVTFRLPEQITVNYDLHRFRIGGAWTGGFLDLSETHHYRQRGEQLPKPQGEPLAGMSAYAWELGGNFALSESIKPPRGPVDSALANYHGHYLHGDRAVLSYAIGGREVLESINAFRVQSLPIVEHILRVAAGSNTIRLRVAQAETAGSNQPALRWQLIDQPVGPDSLSTAPNDGAASKQMTVAAVKPTDAYDKDSAANIARHTVKGPQARDLDLGTPNRTTLIRFKTNAGGTLIASAPDSGKWQPNGKSLMIRGGRLVYDIGWVGAISGKSTINDDRWHLAAISVSTAETRLFIDGQLEGSAAGFLRPPVDSHVLKIGATATNFGGDYSGEIAWAAIIDRVLDQQEIKQLNQAEVAADDKLLWSWHADPKHKDTINADRAPIASPVNQVWSVTAVESSPEEMRWQTTSQQEAVLEIPASDQPILIRLFRATVNDQQLEPFRVRVQSEMSIPIVDISQWTHGGDVERWPERLQVRGSLGESLNGYALDAIPIPFQNPWNAWIRTSGLDFFADGRCVVTTHGGDVYIVDGIDQSLENVSWKRFAAGLFEPFGVRVVNDSIYVTCRDGLKRLHDRDGNGEADFIEAFWNDDDVSSMFHAYNFDLQTDSQGNFYFAKAGQYTNHHRPGTIMKIPSHGGQADVVAWGLRTPNGMGKLSDDRFTVSDNQGPWMPAGKISLIRPNGFYGNMPLNREQDAWLRAKYNGQLPESFDEPIIWMPQELDNSCGGQVWSSDSRWGPLANRLIHSSFGKGWLYYLSLQELDGVMQSSIVALPHQWDAGVMRLRVNPVDGQMYGTGLSGWQGPNGGDDGCLQRLRYTGQTCRIVDQVEVTAKGIALTFNFAVGTDAADSNNWKLQMWDYLWSAKYGSEQFSVMRPGERGRDPLLVKEISISADGKRVELTIPELAVCDQLWLQMDFDDAAGAPWIEQVYMTIHRLPKN